MQSFFFNLPKRVGRRRKMSSFSLIYSSLATMDYRHGLAKSSLILEYACRHMHSIPFSVILLSPANDPSATK